MKLQQFIVAALVASFSLVAPTQAIAKDKKYVAITSIVEHPALDSFKDGVVAGLAEKGYTEADNLRVKFQTAQGNTAIAAQIARQYVGENPDAIVAIGTPSAQAVVAATKRIPVVFGAVTDPVVAQLVPDAGASGTNVTGMSDALPLGQTAALVAQTLPEAKTIGIVYNPGEANSKVTVSQLEQLLPTHGYTVLTAAAPRTVDVGAAGRSLVGKVDVILSTTDNNVVAAYESLAKVSLDTKLPLIASDTDSVPRGAIAALGVNYYTLGVQAGHMTARILSGEAAGEIPWATSSELATHLNLKMAQRIGVELSADLLERAEKVYD